MIFRVVAIFLLLFLLYILIRKLVDKKNNKRKIYITTDGYFNANSKKYKTNRRVLCVDERDNGDIAISKITSREGRTNKKNIVKGVVLNPWCHSSLTKSSLVQKEVHYYRKHKVDGKPKYDPIRPEGLTPTKDRIGFIKYWIILLSQRKKKSNRQKKKDWHTYKYKNNK